MRTLSEIIDSAQDGQRPTEEECYWAMLCLAALYNRSLMKLFKLSTAVKNDDPKLKLRADLYATSAFDSNKSAMNVTPQHYLGPSHDPATEECQKWRKMSKGILRYVASQPHNAS